MFYDLESAVKNCTTRLWPAGTWPDFLSPSFIHAVLFLTLCMMFCAKRHCDTRDSGDISGCQHLQRFTAIYPHSFPRNLRPLQLRVHFISTIGLIPLPDGLRFLIPLAIGPSPPHYLEFIFCMHIAIRYLRRFHILEVRFTGLCLCKPPVRFGG
jgi:hypothetical protein